ncbi:hypothetical protein [Campylobacter estrildidarum]|uniref:Uncharacterized protein n=1 Tax=Campylobacter estrildidarum TaxID=2510189 RepID=A0A4U7BHH5_9BACT|nr:hypothetical protein [Campylobacter estrildidarum]TKX29505.1 hypothetical protein CQA69_07335 [Campylobacter estrildidarum]
MDNIASANKLREQNEVLKIENSNDEKESFEQEKEEFLKEKESFEQEKEEFLKEKESFEQEKEEIKNLNDKKGKK